MGIVWLWSVLALRFLQVGNRPVHALLVGLGFAQPLVTSAVAGAFVAIPLTLIVAAVVAIAWLHVAPRLDLDWAPDQTRMPRARTVDNGTATVEIENVRNARYRSTTDFDVVWETRRYRLDELRTVDYVVEPFGVLHGMAHTLLSFGFGDGRYLAISVEVRRERPEIFGPVKGLFRQYELMYVIGDERDLIGLRANIRRDAVYVYPTRASPAQVQDLFRSMLNRANALAENPEFYNTLTNNCATNILDHANELLPERVPFTLRVAIPGLSAKFAYDHGLFATDLPFAEAREKYRINDRSAFIPEVEDPDGVKWSAQIRESGPA